MADRVVPTQVSRTGIPANGLSVEKVKTSLRKPFDIPSTYRWLTVATLVLGLFLSMEWQTPAADPPITPDYPRQVSRETITRLEAEQKELKQTISDLRASLADVQKDTSSRRSALAGLNAELDSQRTMAGMVPLAGPGVQVLLDDSSAKSIPADEDPANYIVHDYDIRDVVGILWDAGAEAIAIGDERVVSVTSIYCVGSTILVNDTRMSPPYRITAIGPPEMMDALNSQGQLQKLKQNARQYGVQFKVSQEKEITVPAFSGRFTSRYAQPNTTR
jgi:uncharacterized protein YlxW (UPF0749 family)